MNVFSVLKGTHFYIFTHFIIILQLNIFSGDTVWISGVPLNILLPATPQYITYDGSLTQPGCQESVTWVIYNKPIYVLKEQVTFC